MNSESEWTIYHTIFFAATALFAAVAVILMIASADVTDTEKRTEAQSVEETSDGCLSPPEQTNETGAKYRVTEAMTEIETQVETEICTVETEAMTETQVEIVFETQTETEAVSEVEYDPTLFDDAVLIAKTIGVEALYCSTVEQAAVAWCILNRVDDQRYPATVYENVTPTSPRQFAYYPETPLRDDLYELALDVISRWLREKAGEVEVGRVLPKEYLYFTGDGKHNYFRIVENKGDAWDWSLDDPYA